MKNTALTILLALPLLSPAVALAAQAGKAPPSTATYIMKQEAACPRI